MKLFVKVTAVLCCLSFLLLGVCAEDTPELKTYTYTDASPIVPTADIFKTIYEKATDIRIEGERAAWVFLYENIFRTTGKWRPFSSAVSLVPAGDSACDPEIAALAGDGAYYLDLHDGDLYPGTAVVYVNAGDLLSADVPYMLYVYGAPGKEEGARATLRAVAHGLEVGTDGTISLTLTEAHDFLIVPGSEEARAALSAYAYVPDYDAGGGFFGGANLGFVIFFMVIGLALAGLCIYLITVKILIKRRRAGSQKKTNKKKRRC